MCRRNNLVHRRVTSVGQKVKKKAVEIAKQFLEDMKNVNLQILQTWMKLRVTLIFLDLQLLIKNGVQTVKVKTTGAECLHFTLALTAGVKKTENGFTPFRLTPLLIFKNLVKAPPGKYPAGMADLGLKTGGGGREGGGWAMKCSMMKETYVKCICKRRPGGFFNTGKSILLMDLAKSYLGDEVE